MLPRRRSPKGVPEVEMIWLEGTAGIVDKVETMPVFGYTMNRRIVDNKRMPRNYCHRENAKVSYCIMRPGRDDLATKQGAMK